MPIWMLAGRFLAAGDVEVAAARRAGADEDRVPVFGQQRLQAVDALAAAELDAEVEDVVALLVDDRFGQAEVRDLRAHHAAGLAGPDRTPRSVAERREVARDRERGGAAADQRDALAVLLGRRAWAGGARMSSLKSAATRLAGRSRPAPSRRGRAGRPARTAGRRCVRGFPETRSTSN